MLAQAAHAGGRARARGGRALVRGARCACCPPRTPAPAGAARRRSPPRWPRPGSSSEALATLLEVLGSSRRSSPSCARLVAACAACENLLGRHGAAHERLVHALAELPDDGSAVGGGARGRARRRRALRQRLRRAAAAGRTRAARDAPTRSATPACVAVTAALECFARYGRGDSERAEAARARAAAALDALADEQLAGRLDAPYYLGFAEYFCERYDDAIRHLRRALAIARATGQGQFVVPMMVGLAHALERAGACAEALDTAEAAVEAARLTGNRAGASPGRSSARPGPPR